MRHSMSNNSVTLNSELEITYKSLNIVKFESLGTVFYPHFIATMAVSLAVSTQYTNVTDTAGRHSIARHRAPLATTEQNQLNHSHQYGDDNNNESIQDAVGFLVFVRIRHRYVMRSRLLRILRSPNVTWRHWFCQAVRLRRRGLRPG